MRTIMLKAMRAAAAAAMLAGPTALLAAPLVVRSQGPSARVYPPGRAVGDNVPLVLKAGDVVTVLAPSGARTLRGPGTFKVAAATNAAPAAFNPRSRFSAMRGPETPPAPGLWDIDVSRSGNFCLADSSQVLLWRPTSSADITLQVTPAGGAGQKLAWGAGSMMLRWPQQLPIADGAEYALQLADSGESSRLTFKTLAAVADDRTALAKAFIDHGCEGQLDLLIRNSPEE